MHVLVFGPEKSVAEAVIKGNISLGEKFPFSESRSIFIKVKEFIATAYRTYLRADKARLKRQKRQV